MKIFIFAVMCFALADCDEPKYYPYTSAAKTQCHNETQGIFWAAGSTDAACTRYTECRQYGPVDVRRAAVEKVFMSVCLAND